MRYQNSTSFRQALEDRIKSEYSANQIPRIRKMIAFDRFMARLGSKWVLKGGYAIQLRTHKSRATQDIDLLAKNIPKEAIENNLRKELNRDLGDHFRFQLAKPNITDQSENSIRFQVMCLVDGRTFEQFHIDAGFSDPLITPIDFLSPPPLLEFAGIKSPKIPIYSIYQHIAEKVHAIARKRNRSSSRVKDFVDIILFAGIANGISSKKLSKAISTTFATYKDDVPKIFDSFPKNWSGGYSRIAKELNLSIPSFDEAITVASSFISPILNYRNLQKRIWNISKRKWV